MRAVIPVLTAALLGVGGVACTGASARSEERQRARPSQTAGRADNPPTKIRKIERTNAEWQRRLTRDEFLVLRRGGTERAFSGRYVHTTAKGVYRCAACGLPLFDSDDKYNSGSGWPSFTRPFHRSHVIERVDRSHGMTRIELICARCGSHLGHVFPDGPGPTHQRFCINSLSLKLQPEKTRR